MSDKTDVHSALYFGDTRDAWWNDDYVALLAARTRLSSRRRVLDVGTGFGHFARTLLPHLAEGSSLVGVDPEAVSIEEATRRTEAFVRARSLDVTVAFRTGRVEALPFADGSFDAVVAQTVLIHVADVRAALAEMARVLAPGGLLLLAEPNNVAGLLSEVARRTDVDIERWLRVAALEMRCELGKARLGLGFNSLGESLGGYIDPALYGDVRVWLGDKAFFLAPPYASPEQRAEIAERRDFAERGIWSWPREEARGYYAAAGADLPSFDEEYDLALAVSREVLEAIDRGAYAAASTGPMIVLAATRCR